MKQLHLQEYWKEFSKKKKRAHAASSCFRCDMIEGDGGGSKNKQVLTCSCFFLFYHLQLFFFFILECFFAFGLSTASLPTPFLAKDKNL